MAVLAPVSLLRVTGPSLQAIGVMAWALECPALELVKMTGLGSRKIRKHHESVLCEVLFSQGLNKF